MSYKLYLVRHGQTDWNAEHRLQGSQDIDLNSVGKRQAKANGETLSWILPQAAPYQLISSPLLRAANTMQVIAQALGKDKAAVRYDERITEISFGSWEGMTLEDISHQSPEELHGYETDPFAFTPKGGESYQQASVRVADFLSSLTTDSIIVTHAGIIRVIFSLLSKATGRSATRLRIPQDQVLIVQGTDCRWIRASSNLEGQ